MTAGSGLLDTSIFIAQETGRPLGDLPEQVAVSVVTIGELDLGVLSAVEGPVRARRAGTLAFARRFEPLPVNESVMRAWANLVIDCRAAGIARTVKLTDALIAATAIDLGLEVVTQDADYDRMAEVHPALRVRRV